MSARDAILAAARANAPPHAPLPDVPRFGWSGRPAERFAEAAHAAGARVVAAEDPDAAVRAAYPDAARVASTAPEVAGSVALDGSPHALADLDLLVCRAVLGVAENGAVWLPESRLGARAAPFLALHVAVVLDRAAVVGTMHEAYARLGLGSEGFGVFVAGPSKTADIEQSLVVGAHGPLSLTVVLVGSGPDE